MTPWMVEALTLALEIAGALALVLAVRLVGAGVELLPISRSAKVRAQAWLPVLALVAIVLYVAVALHWLLDRGGLGWTVPLLIIAAGVAAGWGVMRDVADGVVVRSSQAYRVGDYLSLGELAGRVVDLGWRSLVLETRDGTVATLPYSHLARRVVQRAPRADHAHFHVFRLPLPDGVPVPELKRAVRRALLLSPWCLYRREPEVRAVGSELEVVVGLVDADHEAEAEEQARVAAQRVAQRLASPRAGSTSQPTR